MSLPREELLVGMNSTIMKKIENPLGTTIFAAKELNRLIKPMNSVVLPRRRICGNVPLTIRHGPADSLGMGMNNLLTTQGVEKEATWIEEMHSESFSGPMLKANHEP